jgi:hypothetical protein
VGNFAIDLEMVLPQRTLSLSLLNHLLNTLYSCP